MAKPILDTIRGSCWWVNTRTSAISNVIDCSAFGGRKGLGDDTWYLQSSIMTDANMEIHLDRSSGAAMLASRVGDAERERDLEPLPE